MAARARLVRHEGCTVPPACQARFTYTSVPASQNVTCSRNMPERGCSRWSIGPAPCPISAQVGRILLVASRPGAALGLDMWTWVKAGFTRVQYYVLMLSWPRLTASLPSRHRRSL